MSCAANHFEFVIRIWIPFCHNHLTMTNYRPHERFWLNDFLVECALLFLSNWGYITISWNMLTFFFKKNSCRNFIVHISIKLPLAWQTRHISHEYSLCVLYAWQHEWFSPGRNEESLHGWAREQGDETISITQWTMGIVLFLFVRILLLSGDLCFRCMLNECITEISTRHHCLRFCLSTQYQMLQSVSIFISNRFHRVKIELLFVSLLRFYR